MFTIPWKPVHVAVESVFTIPWKHCSPSRGIRTIDSLVVSQWRLFGSHFTVATDRYWPSYLCVKGSF